jgi:uncharacterized membrane protein YhaH (DUF805 family)
VDLSEHFFFPSRLHRLGYLIRVVILDICLWLLYTGRPSDDPAVAWTRLLLVSVVGLALAIYGIFFVLLPRLVDAGMSGWWVLLGLFPFIGPLFQLVLVFVPTKRDYHDEQP